ncbi:MAG: hypothetical protein ACKVK8_03905 [Rhodospirillales bacterium]
MSSRVLNVAGINMEKAVILSDVPFFVTLKQHGRQRECFGSYAVR